MKRLLSTRILIAAAALLAGVGIFAYFQSQPKIAPGQEPLTDIQSIETLRTQFNLDAGKPRLIILVSPT